MNQLSFIWLRLIRHISTNSLNELLEAINTIFEEQTLKIIVDFPDQIPQSSSNTALLPFPLRPAFDELSTSMYTSAFRPLGIRSLIVPTSTPVVQSRTRIKYIVRLSATTRTFVNNNVQLQLLQCPGGTEGQR